MNATPHAIELLRSYAVMFRAAALNVNRIKGASNGDKIGASGRLLEKADSYDRAAWALVIQSIAYAFEMSRHARSDLGAVRDGDELLQEMSGFGRY